MKRPRINGKIIQQTLLQMKNPATMKELVAFLAEKTQSNPDDMKPGVMEILKNGADFGFIQRKRGRYYVEALDDGTQETMQSDSEMEIDQSSRSPSRTRSQLRSGSQYRRASKRRLSRDD